MTNRMEPHEGFHGYWENGGAVAKGCKPWYFKASEMECFSTRGGQYHRPEGADGHAFRRPDAQTTLEAVRAFGVGCVQFNFECS
jgi:hypothetical protein